MEQDHAASFVFVGDEVTTNPPLMGTNGIITTDLGLGLGTRREWAQIQFAFPTFF